MFQAQANFYITTTWLITHLWHLVPTLNNFKLPTLNNSLPPSRQFSRNKMLLKKLSSGKSLLNKLLNLKKGAWAPGRTYIAKTSYFQGKIKIFKG